MYRVLKVEGVAAAIEGGEVEGVWVVGEKGGMSRRSRGWRRRSENGRLGNVEEKRKGGAEGKERRRSSRGRKGQWRKEGMATRGRRRWGKGE